MKYDEQFWFLRGRLMHEAIKSAQEGIHLTKHVGTSIGMLKLDLSKAYDRANWKIFRFLLIHIGFYIFVVYLIMAMLFLPHFQIYSME